MKDRPEQLALGYAAPFVARPGDRVEVHVAGDDCPYESSVVRLDAGPEDRRRSGVWPDGEGVAAASGSTFGSWLEVGPSSEFRDLRSFSLSFWIYPTLLTPRPQVVMGTMDPGVSRGWQVTLEESGSIGISWDLAESDEQERFRGAPVTPRTWNHVLLIVDAANGTVRISVDDAVSGSRTDRAIGGWDGDRLVIGAPHGRTRPVSADGNGCLNGKLAEPAILRAPVGEEATAALRYGDFDAVAADLLCRLDLSRAIGSTRFEEVSSHGLPVEVFNLPTAGVTGPRWHGRSSSFVEDPEGYAALHFHDDDLDDARWPVGLGLDLPDETPSGLYAVCLKTADHEDQVPFVVSAAGRGKERTGEGLAVLLPTLTYLAYADEHELLSNPDSYGDFTGLEVEDVELTWRDGYAIEEGYLSLYDVHRDGSTVPYASLRRPLLNMRPDYVWPLIGGPHGVGMDLRLLRWLEARGFDYEVIADHDLDRDGEATLDGFRAVITGGHPEYWTSPMLNGLEGYLDAGGRLVYLGGNGLYWVTGIDPERRYVAEVRRGQAGSRPSSSPPGENRLTTTREMGGLWRHRGRASQELLGVGTTATGAGRGRPYKRTRASRDPRFSWVFEGIQDDEVGAAGGILGGVAGYEFDRADSELGTPPHATVIASATDFAEPYRPMIEDFTGTGPQLGDSSNGLVRADMVMAIDGDGGGVFSTGSAAWCGSLADESGDSTDVGILTANVIRRFLSVPRGTNPLETEAET